MPKAEGTSLDGILQQVYGDRLLIAQPLVGWPQKWAPDFVEMIEQKGDHYDALSGHVTYGIHDIFKRKARYISTVRDPTARFESYYNFVQHWKIHHHYEAAKGMSISDFFRFLEDRDDIELYNLQCLLLCGEKSFQTAANAVYEKYCGVIPLQLFNACIPFLAEKLGWPEITIPHLNATKHKSQIDQLSARERNALIEGNREDANLVQFCIDELDHWFN
jgi:hypothetical protein